jgi:hypothetical protein
MVFLDVVLPSPDGKTKKMMPEKKNHSGDPRCPWGRAGHIEQT